MAFIDRIRKGSIFVEPRNRPARFNPSRFIMRVREFSTQIGSRKRLQRFKGRVFQPVPQRRVFGQSSGQIAGQPLPPKWRSKGFKA